MWFFSEQNKRDWFPWVNNLLFLNVITSLEVIGFWLSESLVKFYQASSSFLPALLLKKNVSPYNCGVLVSLKIHVKIIYALKTFSLNNISVNVFKGGVDMSDFDGWY